MLHIYRKIGQEYLYEYVDKNEIMKNFKKPLTNTILCSIILLGNKPYTYI